MYYIFNKDDAPYLRIWTVWFLLFGVEMWVVMIVSCATPSIGFVETHLNVRMGLLTLIIMGEGVISVTRLVDKTVDATGWTKWSFVHILGVTSNVVCLHVALLCQMSGLLIESPFLPSTLCGWHISTSLQR